MKRRLRKIIKPLTGSILISLMLWFMVTTSKEFTTVINVPLKISRLARGKTLSKSIPNNVSIEINGSGQSIIALYFYDAQFRLNLPNINKSQKLNLEEYLDFLDIPTRLGLNIVKIIEPTTLDLQVDNQKIILKPVRFSGKLIPEPGYVLLDTIFNQDSIRVIGPETLINNIAYISTQPVIYNNKKYPFQDFLTMQPPDSDLFIISPAEINIQFDIQRIVERVVYEVPIKIKNVPKKLVVESIPSSLSLRVKGGEKLVEKLNVDEIIAEIDYTSQYKPEQVEFPVSIKTPTNISWLESSPKTFKLIVRRK